MKYLIEPVVDVKVTDTLNEHGFHDSMKSLHR